MNLYLRLFYRLLVATLSPKQRTAMGTITPFRVLPTDIDVFGHMNNGRYAQIFDVSRSEWMLRTGILGAMRRHGWGAVIGGSVVRFRRPLRLLQRYQVETHLIGWDDRWFYLEHRAVTTSGALAASALCRAALLRKGEWVPTGTVVEIVDPAAEARELPQCVKSWIQVDQSLSDSLLNSAEAARNTWPAVSRNANLVALHALGQTSR